MAEAITANLTANSLEITGSLLYVITPNLSAVEINIHLHHVNDQQHIVHELNTFDRTWFYPYVTFNSSVPPAETVLTVHGEINIETFDIADTESIGLSFLQDYYYRIHISYTPMNVGNVVSTQYNYVDVWNSFFTSNLLSDIPPTDLDGVSISSPVLIPHTFTPLQNLTFTITVSDKGSPYIDGFYTFQFASGDAFLYITGQRVIVWGFIPILPFTESKQWVTDIIQLKESEARYQIREYPRMGLSYTCLLNSQEKYSYARTLINNVVNYALGLPQWSVVTEVGALSAGVSTIPCDTTYLELLDTNEVIIIYEDWDKFDVLEVDSFTADTINTKTNIINDYTKCFVAPVRVGYAKDGITLTRQVQHEITANITLSDIVFNYSSPDWQTTDTFLGFPILETTPIVTGNITDTVERPNEFFDSVSYGLDLYSPIEYNRYHSQIRLYAHTKPEQYSLRRKLEYLKGKFSTFWLPTYNRDIVATQPISLGINKLYVNAFGWTKYKEKYVRVQGSSTAYFQVIDVELDPLFPDDEILLLSPTPTENIVNINKVDVMYKVRADADRFEYQYESGVMKVTIPVIEET